MNLKVGFSYTWMGLKVIAFLHDGHLRNSLGKYNSLGRDTFAPFSYTLGNNCQTTLVTSVKVDNRNKTTRISPSKQSELTYPTAPLRLACYFGNVTVDKGKRVLS